MHCCWSSASLCRKMARVTARGDTTARDVTSTKRARSLAIWRRSLSVVLPAIAVAVPEEVAALLLRWCSAAPPPATAPPPA